MMLEMQIWYLWRDTMKEIIAYEMSFKKEIEYSDEGLCIPFQKNIGMNICKNIMSVFVK